jgi:hypothetical protein
VIHRLLVTIAFVCCALCFISFALFARDQLAGASQQQQQELVSGPVTTSNPHPVHHQTAQPRRFIDSAAKTLTSPFDSLVTSNSAWVEEIVPTLCAFLIYGVGLGYLARYSSGIA